MPRNNQYNKAKGIADIVFLIDSTGSMGGCIDGLKKNLNTFFTTLADASANSGCAIQDWRAKIVGFRDIEEDGSDWLENYPFVRDIDQLRSQLTSLEAEGGGDAPESLLDALFTLSQMGETAHGSEDPQKWRRASEAVRAVAVFTDAPFKPKMRVRGAEGGTIEDAINFINSTKMKLFIFAPNDSNYEKLSTANFVEFTSVGGSGLDSVTSDQSVFEQLLKQLAATISSSKPDPL